MSDDATNGAGMPARPEPAQEASPHFGAGAGGWQPLGEYDTEATMHVSFSGPFPDPAAVSHGMDPLAAPGHGYAPPPQQPPAPEQSGAEPESWWQPLYPEPPQEPGPGGHEAAAPAEGAPWPQAEPAEQAGSGHWSVPFVPDDVAEESGEYAVGAAAAPHPAGGDPQPADLPYVPEYADSAGQPEPPAEPAGHQGAAGGPAAAGAAAPLGPEPPAGPSSDHPTASYVLRVNGSDRPVTDAWLGESLLYVLRERLGLAGVKDGCEQGECGACSVQVDGRLIASCLLPAATAAGSEVRTVEGLSQGGGPSDVQRALAESGAVQCGFCVPGMVMTVHDLLEGNHHPTELETRQALCGNLCRCSGYQGVLDAVGQVVAAREAAAAEEAVAAAPAGDAAAAPEPAAAGPGAWIPQQSSGPADGGPAA